MHVFQRCPRIQFGRKVHDTLRLFSFAHSRHFSSSNLPKKTAYVTIMCRNDELSSTTSCVGCLLTDSGLLDT